MSTSPKTIVIWDEEARDQAIRWLASLPLDPLRPPVLTVEPYEEPPTDDQRGYYFSTVLSTLCARSGYRKHEVDKFLRDEFGQKVRMEVFGTVRDVAVFTMSNRGSKKASTVFLDMVLQWADEHDLYIPPPRAKA